MSWQDRGSTPKLRRRAIDEVVERSRKIPDVARDLGIKSPETLRAWVRADAAASPPTAASVHQRGRNGR
jgi:transposase-like protein